MGTCERPIYYRVVWVLMFRELQPRFYLKNLMYFLIRLILIEAYFMPALIKEIMDRLANE